VDQIKAGIMNLYKESMEQKPETRRSRIGFSLIVLGIVYILYFFDNWYFAPTIPFSRLPYCVREIFFEPYSDIDSKDRRISGMFATEARREHHFGNIYEVLQFSEDGTVAFYGVADQNRPFVNPHRLALWMKWFEKPSLTPDDIPQIFDDVRFGGNKHIAFFISPPEKGVYVINQGELSINWNVEQKWSTSIVDETWTGKLVDGQLNMNVLLSSGLKVDHTYFYINYDTCPLQELH
jgi:hypothetical protein